MMNVNYLKTTEHFRKPIKFKICCNKCSSLWGNDFCKNLKCDCHV
jgi:hypothetical protein